MKWCIYIFLFLFVATPVFSQKIQTGSWNVANVKFTVNEHWNAFSELQIRSVSLYNHFYYYELKGAVTYSFQKNYSFSIGTGLYNTFNGGDDYEGFSKQKEFRLWQQFIMNQKLSVLYIEQRYRSEQRFLKTYANRFRYRLNICVPINKLEIVEKTLFAVINNEVFLTDQLPVFRRNRFYFGGGYRFTNKFALQMGRMNQADYTTNNHVSKNYFFSALYFDL